jgi:hypothetical protein
MRVVIGDLPFGDGNGPDCSSLSGLRIANMADRFQRLGSDLPDHGADLGVID